MESARDQTLVLHFFLITYTIQPNCLETAQASMVADDTNISSCGNLPAEIEQKLNTHFENGNRWLIAN